MQGHEPTKYKIESVYHELTGLPFSEYNAIGRRSIIKDLKSKNALTSAQEELLAELEAEDKREYTPRDYMNFKNEFTWVEED